MSHRTTFLTDPAWPWSSFPGGLLALLVVGLLLAVLTVWTYRGITVVRWRRVLTLLALRLAALVVAVLVVLRPALGFRDEARQPSLLLIACDDSESMSIQDEYDGQSRWQQMQRVLRRAQPVLDRLRDDSNTDVVLHRFSTEVRPFDPADPAATPAGKQSDYGLMLQNLLDRYHGERHLRGLVVLGDGADNGVRHQPLPLAAQWRDLPCPIFTFGLGRETTGDRQADVVLTGIQTEPAVVPVKSKMIVRATLDAPGFENRPIRIHALIDDVEVPVLVKDKEAPYQEETPRLSEGNAVEVAVNAPTQPGEVKVTLRVEPQRGELSPQNNEISTFATISKEGLSVLLIDKARYEPAFIARALRTDPRIRLYDVNFRGAAAAVGDLFGFRERAYDVILIGDVTPEQMRSGDPEALRTIKSLVRDRGTGLLMYGGHGSFGAGGWDRTELADMLPVLMDAREQSNQPTRLVLTEQGKTHFILRLAEHPAESAALWDKLVPLDGMSLMGRERANTVAAVLARAPSGEPVLAAMEYGKGRTLAFAGDTTKKWVRPPDGHQVHSRFWRQLVLWLARQEEAAGNAWVRLDTRRLGAGAKLNFRVGLRGKGGVELPGARYETRVIGPDGAEVPVTTQREKDEDRGSFWKTDAPGVYRVVVKAAGKEADGSLVTGEASARFLVAQDDTEMARRAADHAFLRRLADAGGGRFDRADQEAFAKFLESVLSQPLPQERPKMSLWPDWRSRKTGVLQPGVLVLFASLVCLEWFLRRRWGLV